MKKGYAIIGIILLIWTIYMTDYLPFQVITPLWLISNYERTYKIVNEWEDYRPNGWCVFALIVSWIIFLYYFFLVTYLLGGF